MTQLDNEQNCKQTKSVVCLLYDYLKGFTLFGNSRRECIWTIGMALLIPMWIGLSNHWYVWYDNAGCFHFLRSLYSVLNGNWLVNIPLCFLIGYPVYTWNKKILMDANLRCYRFVFAVLCLFLINWNCEVEYAHIIDGFSYKTLFSLFAIITIIIFVYRIFATLRGYISLCRRASSINPDIKGFSVDNANNDNIPENLKKYAANIAERLCLTDISDHSYALGVVGEWGVGKTTFLDILKEELNKHADIVDFNPWMCRTPEQVTQDFFASLRQQLSPKYSTLSKSIKEYAKYLSTLNLSPHQAFNIDMIFPVNDESLFELKQNLSDKFSHLKRPVVIFIDDIDRLDRNEVFEVLRLIRNTADLRNIIYIVAYDKDYVTSVLEERNIKDASSYLEKIFPIELHLPKVEENLIWDTLKNDIASQNSIGQNFTEQLFKRLENSDKELILHILNNFRRVKRFARVYTLTISYIHVSQRNEVKYLDLFWLVLLQIYDKDVYNILSSDPNTLLYLDKDRYKLLNGLFRKTTEKEHVYKGEILWKPDTPKILGWLFGDFIKVSKLSLCYAENYQKYFTLSVSPFRLSVKEAQALLADDVDVKDTIERWLNSGKYFSSIAYQLKQIKIAFLQENKLKNFISGILYFGLDVVSYRHSHVWIVNEMLANKRYSHEYITKLHDIVLQWIQNRLNEGVDFDKLSRFLKQLYVTQELDENGKQLPMNSLVIDNSDVERSLSSLMRIYLSKKSELTAVDLLTEGTELSNVFKNCCVNTVDAMEAYGTSEFKQFGFDIVIKYFANKKIKPHVNEYEDAFSSLFAQSVPIFENSHDEDMYWDYMSEENDRKMQEYFGSDYDSKTDNKLEKFKKECFND